MTTAKFSSHTVLMEGKASGKNCVSCGATIGGRNTYCSNQCQADRRYRVYIQKWLAKEVSGLQRLGVVSRYVKRYLREKFQDQCCQCGWSEINKVTGAAPLVADHIDGNWRNNTPQNLRLLCPNCDSLSATYAGLNRGRGRSGRHVSNRVVEARSLSLYDNAYVGKT